MQKESLIDSHSANEVYKKIITNFPHTLVEILSGNLTLKIEATRYISVFWNQPIKPFPFLVQLRYSTILLL